MSIRTILAAAGTAALALGLTATPALADELPQAGDECKRTELRETVELDGGVVLECALEHGSADPVWQIIVDPTEEPTDEPTQEPTEGPTDEPNGEPTPGPTEEPTQEPTDEPGEPAPDEWTEFVSLLEQAPVGVEPGRFCKGDDALLVYAWSDTSAVQCQYNPESERHHWVEVHGFEDLVVEDEDPTDPEDPDQGEDSDHKPAPPTDNGQDPATGDASDRSLPVTGSALAGLVVAAMTATGAGATALWATRRRSEANEDGETREDDAA